MTTRCEGCGFSLGEVNRLSTGEMLCRSCAGSRLEQVPEPAPAVQIRTAPERTTWAPVELAPVLAGEELEPPPTMLTRSDGVCLLYLGRVHECAAEPESTKGWLACGAAEEVLEGGGTVVYVDFEDSAASLVSRMRALGVEDSVLRDRFVYVRPDEPLTGSTESDVRQLLARAPALVVIDGVTEALMIHGLALNDSIDIAKWLDLLPRRAARQGAAVLLLDHVVKDREQRGRYSLGGGHKLAGVDVAYGLDVVYPFGRGRDGLVRVVVRKDRPGHVRQHEDGNKRIADLRLTSDLGSGRVGVSLAPPDQAPAFRPTVLMHRIGGVVAAEPGISTNRIRQDVKGRNDAKQEAIRQLVEGGYIERRQERGGYCFYLLRPFSEDDLAPSPQGRPNLAPAKADHPRPFAPAPTGGGAGGGHGKANGKVQPRPAPRTPVDEFIDRTLREFPGSHELEAGAA